MAYSVSLNSFLKLVKSKSLIGSEASDNADNLNFPIGFLLNFRRHVVLRKYCYFLTYPIGRSRAEAEVLS